jgi:hypothetical protein
MATLSDIIANGSPSPTTVRGLAPPLDRMHGSLGRLAGSGPPLAARSLGRCRLCAHGCFRQRRGEPTCRLQYRMRRGSFPSIGKLHPPAIRLERTSTTCSASKPRRSRTGAAGSTMAAGAFATPWAGGLSRCRQEIPIHSCQRRAKACIRFRSDRYMPGSSSLAISASPPAARRWSGSRSGWAMSIAASRASWPGPNSNRQRAGRARLGRQHRGLRHRLCAGGRSRTRPRSSAACPLAARTDGRTRTARQPLGDIGAICNDASFALMHAHCGILRERILRTAHSCYGHRLMRDCVRPGGLAVDLAPEGPSAVRALLAELRARFPALVELYDGTTSLQDRTVGTGHLESSLALQYAAGGYIGRASGRAFDARRHIAYPPYDSLQFEVPVLEAGDVNARVWIRIREVEQSLSLIEQILDRLPEGPVRSEISPVPEAREGMAIVEGFAATSWSGFGSRPMVGSSAAICAIRRGSSGRCWKPPSRETSWPTFRCATSRSTVPTPVTISEGA